MVLIEICSHGPFLLFLVLVSHIFKSGCRSSVQWICFLKTQTKTKDMPVTWCLTHLAIASAASSCSCTSPPGAYPFSKAIILVLDSWPRATTRIIHTPASTALLPNVQDEEVSGNTSMFPTVGDAGCPWKSWHAFHKLPGSGGMSSSYEFVCRLFIIQNIFINKLYALSRCCVMMIFGFFGACCPTTLVLEKSVNKHPMFNFSSHHFIDQ